jgi:hypothetical protein
MITTENFLNTVNHRITGGSEYQWQCFGTNARYLDSEIPEHCSASIVFDTQTQVVYEATVCDYAANRAYRWINPEFKAAYDAEVQSRNAEDQAWDEVGYTDLEIPEDWLDKARAIVTGDSYDTRVSIPLDLPDSEMLRLMVMAHERDMTFNDFVTEILEQAIAQAQLQGELEINGNDAMRSRLTR